MDFFLIFLLHVSSLASALAVVVHEFALAQVGSTHSKGCRLRTLAAVIKKP